MGAFRWPRISKPQVAKSSCEELWPELSAYADAEAASEDSIRIEFHLASCDSCVSALAFVRSTTTAFGSISEIEPPESLRSVILSATVDADGAAVRRPALLPRLSAARFATYGMALASGVAAAWILLVVNPESRVAQPVDGAIAFRPPALSRTTPSPLPNAEQRPPEEIRTDSKALVQLAPQHSEAHSKPSGFARSSAFPADRTPVQKFVQYASKVTISTRPAGPQYKSKFATALPMPEPSEMAERMKEMSDMATAGKVGIETSPMETMDPANRSVTIEPAVATSRVATKIVLTASSTVMPTEKIASLAGLKRSLQAQKPAWRLPDSVQNPRDRLIQIDLVRGSF